MSRARIAALLLVALTAATAAPARAQEAPPDPTTTVPTTAPADPATTTTTTLLPPVLPSIPPPPPTTAPIKDPDAGGDAPPEAVPVLDVPIPPRTETIDAGSLPPPRGRVVQVDVQGATEADRRAKDELALAVARRQLLEAESAKLHAAVAKLGEAGKRAVTELARAERELKQHAVDAYVRGGDMALVAASAPSGAAVDAQLLETSLLTAVRASDDDAVAAYERARRAADQGQQTLATAVARVDALLIEAGVVEQQATRQVESTAFALKVTSAGGNVVIHGFAFPVAPPYSFGDSFGAPRNEGTDLAHWHMGTDIAAAEGQELFAAERGVVTQISGGGLGGNGLWIRGESGTSYYYAHLSRYADDLHAGQLVEAGDVVGYVGTTGHSTGPHLHFEVHPNGGEAINPYPLLKAADPTGTGAT